ncbi:MAG: HEAT repeat domain-containing protein [Candidatus Riflebacteria bacterium]|nr:HEAT repeat domain-containing protein [Candidatus Riflebacteria bacterium]
MMRSDRSWKRQAAVLACGQINAPQIVRLLLHAWRDPEAGVRQAALAGLRRLSTNGNPEATRVLASIQQEGPAGEATPERAQPKPQEPHESTGQPPAASAARPAEAARRPEPEQGSDDIVFLGEVEYADQGRSPGEETDQG